MKGDMDTEVARFSFSGEDANTIILGSQFEGTQVNWDYSLDCGETWTVVTGDRVELSVEELESITMEDGIRIHILGVNYENENISIIDISKGSIKSTVTSNDVENKVVGDTTFLEWRMNETDPWVMFTDKVPNLSGDCSVFVRSIRYETYVTSDVKIFDFTQDDPVDPNRAYISIDDFSMYEFSSEQEASGEYAANIIDANPNTLWHGIYSGTDTEKFITIKLDEPVYLSAVEYLPRSSGSNGRVSVAELYTSLDGVNYSLVAREEGWANNGTLKTIELDSPEPALYVKFHSPENNNTNFISGMMLNFYKDTTMLMIPTAEISYSTTDQTSGSVVATLINPSEEFTIVNNDGKDFYTFTENGSFDFQIKSIFGVTNTVTATVTNIEDAKPEDGSTDEEKPEDGNTGGGNVEDGNTGEEKPEDGNTGDGNIEAEKPEDGNTDGGNVEDGNTGEETPEDGNTGDGNIEAEKPEDGNTDGGNVEDEKPEDEKPEDENTSDGNIEAEKPEDGNTSDGNIEAEKLEDENTSDGNIEAEKSEDENTGDEETEDGSVENESTDQAQKDRVVYDVAEGGTLTFRVEAEFKDFLEVRMDKVKLDTSHYAVSEGSIIVELTEKYLSSLGNGYYILEILASSGTAEIHLEILGADKEKESIENENVLDDLNANTDDVESQLSEDEMNHDDNWYEDVISNLTDGNTMNVLLIVLVIAVLLGVVIIKRKNNTKNLSSNK